MSPICNAKVSTVRHAEWTNICLVHISLSYVPQRGMLCAAIPPYYSWRCSYIYTLTCVYSSHRTVATSTWRHPAQPLCVPILRLRVIQDLWSQNHDTEILHWNAIAVSNAITYHRTICGRHDIQMRAIQKRVIEQNEREKAINEL